MGCQDIHPLLTQGNLPKIVLSRVARMVQQSLDCACANSVSPCFARTQPHAPIIPGVSDPVVQLLRALLGGPLPTSALLADLSLKHRHSFRTRYLRPAMEGGWIEPTLPDKLNNRLQRYHLTAAGRAKAQGLLLTGG